MVFKTPNRQWGLQSTYTGNKFNAYGISDKPGCARGPGRLLYFLQGFRALSSYIDLRTTFMIIDWSTYSQLSSRDCVRIREKETERHELKEKIRTRMITTMNRENNNEPLRVNEMRDWVHSFPMKKEANRHGGGAKWCCRWAEQSYRLMLRD